MKNFTKKITTIILAALTVTAYSCKKDPAPTPEQSTGSMKIQFNYVYGSNEAPFELGKQYVHPKTGDTMTFTTLKFYVSNIKLQKADGSWWTQPESYYLVCNSCDDQDLTSYLNKVITVNNIPNGSYKAMEYTFGVDSARNTSGANTDALSFTNGMFWDWNTGYIMMKAEGTSPNSPNGYFQLHFGGFKGDYNVVTTKQVDFSNKNLVISGGKTGTVTLTANAARYWHSATGLSQVYIIHTEGPDALQRAKDFYDGVYLKSVE